MSRSKSNRTLLIEQERAARNEERERKREERERDKAIREDRRQQKKAEVEAKRKERLRKNLVHESVERNGIPKVQEGNQYFGLRDAIAVNEIMFCESCGHVVRESEMIGDICSICYYANEGRVNDDKDEGLKAKANRAVPGTEDGGKNGTVAPAGQLTLDL